MLAAYDHQMPVPMADRPCSAPAVMLRDPADAATPESVSAVVSHYDNRSMVHEAAVNPRIPRSRVASRFSLDQHPPRSVASFHALLESQQAVQHDEGPSGICLTPAEIARDAHRRYAVPEMGAHNDAARRCAGGAAPKASPGGDTSDVPVMATTPLASPPTLLGRLAAMHHGRLSAVASTVRESRSTASLLGAHQEQLARRARAVVVLQRAIRRFLAASRGSRLTGLLHVLRTECAAPRCPLIVQQGQGTSRSGLVSPLAYLMEVAMEYEYALYVENMAMRLVVDTRAVDTSSPAVYHQRVMLSEAELSDLHETVQQRLAEGETAVTLAQLRGGVRSILSAGGVRVWDAALTSCFVHQQSNGCRRRMRHLPADSFLWSVAADAAQQDAENHVGRAATPAWSCHSSIAPSASHSSSASSFSVSTHTNQQTLRGAVEGVAEGWDHPPTRNDLQHARAIIQAEQASALSTAVTSAVSDLILQTPMEWFAGPSKPPADKSGRMVVSMRGALGVDEGLSTMPRPQATAAATLPTRPSPPPSEQSYQTLEEDLESLWSGNRDPELEQERKRSRQLARRRMLGAEYVSDEDQDDVPIDQDGRDANAATTRASHAASTDEFDSATYIHKRDIAAREAWAHCERTVASALLQQRSTQDTGGSFDPAQWGLDASISSMRQAAEIMATSGLTGKSSEADVSRVVLRLGQRGGGGRAADASTPPSVQRSTCAICEIDAVDVQLCACGGNWVHRECAFDYDVDNPPIAPSGNANSLLRCCRFCTA